MVFVARCSKLRAVTLYFRLSKIASVLAMFVCAGFLLWGATSNAVTLCIKLCKFATFCCVFWQNNGANAIQIALHKKQFTYFAFCCIITALFAFFLTLDQSLKAHPSGGAPTIVGERAFCVVPSPSTSLPPPPKWEAFIGLLAWCVTTKVKGSKQSNITTPTIGNHGNKTHPTTK